MQHSLLSWIVACAALAALSLGAGRASAASESLSWKLDRDGNSVLSIDPNGTSLVRTYDALNRLTRCEVERAPGVEGTTVETYGHDGLSRVTRETDDNGDGTGASTETTVNVYDSLSRLVEQRQSGLAVSSRFFGEGRRHAVVYPGGRRLDEAYDAIDRLSAISDSGAQVASFRWIGAGHRPLSREHANGTRLTYLDDSGTDDIGYDAVRRPVRLRHVGPSGLLVDREYGYDRAGNRTFERRNDAGGLTDRYRYDSAYRTVESRFDEDGAAGAPAPRDLRSLGYELDGVGNPFLFQGQRFDAETGLYYCKNRYYDPSTGRFLTRDTEWDPVNAGNFYTFAGNRPGSASDPLGLKTWAQWWTNDVYGDYIAPVATGQFWAKTGHDAWNAASFGALERQEKLIQQAKADGTFGTAEYWGKTAVNAGGSAIEAAVTIGGGAAVGGLAKGATALRALAIAGAANAGITAAGMGIRAGADVGVLGHTRITAREVLISSGVALLAGAAGEGLSRGAATAAKAAANKEAGAVAEGVQAAQGAPKCPDASCFAAGTLVLRGDGTLDPIERIDVGDRVASAPDRGDYAAPEEAIDPAGWLLVDLVMPLRGTEDTFHISTLRPLAWVEAVLARGGRAGRAVWLELGELGAGYARVSAVGPCPPLQAGPGRLVTTTYRHENRAIVEVMIEGASKPLITTRPHRFYSETRKGWVAAGELVVGERLRALEGSRAITGRRCLAGMRTVYNIEVDGWHTYFVASDESAEPVLVHNACGGIGPVNKGKIGEALSEAEALAAGETIRGPQPTLELPSGRRTRPDLLTETPAGDLKVREAKHGPTAALTDAQRELESVIRRGGTVIPRGKRAIRAGLTPGKPTQLNRFEEDRY